MKKILCLTSYCLLASALCANAAPPSAINVFSDDFESGTMANWTTSVSNPLNPSTVTNIVPPFPGGRWSAYMNTSIDRMHHNIIADNGGVELSGPLLFTSWIYDQGTNSGTVGATRIFNEIRGYAGGTGLTNGSTVASGTLAQLLAVGKFNSVTLPGEVFTTTKYQGRVAFHTPQPAGDTGWFNLNDPGSPNRSVGWHRFDIEVLPGGSTVVFYVDGILSRTFTNATVEPFDTVILGPGLGSQLGDAWIDGMSVGRVREPLQIRCPPDQKLWTCSNSVTLSYPPPTVVGGCQPFTVACDPPPGTPVPVGSVTVVCSASDACNDTVRCEFSVDVTRDTEDPRIFCPNELAVWTCSPNGTNVNFVITASDDCDTNVTITCNPPSGTFFTPGSHPVVCAAVDDCGNQDRCEFRIVVTVDREEPRIVCPSNITLCACSPNGMSVNYLVSATDDCDTNVAVTCVPPPNSFFPPGTNTVTCTATDDCGNQSRCTFTVTIGVDSEPPRIICPTNIVDWTCSTNGKQVGYTVTASDDCEKDVELECTPPPGLFPVGNTQVNCVARDACHTNRCSFIVTIIQDVEPPRIVCPSNIVVHTCLDRMRVGYTVTATDDCDPNPTVICDPPSGSFFPVGTNSVLCTAVDECNHRNECKFEVIVIKDPQPTLFITRLPNGGIRICWPAPSTGYQLQCTGNLGPPIVWQNVTNQVFVMGGMNCVFLPANQRHQFYRLCCNGQPAITGVSATTVRPGDIVTITGSGFGNNPDNLCVTLVEEGGAGIIAGATRLLPMRALSASDTFITARMGPIPADARPGRVMVGLGNGQSGRFRPAFFDIFLAEEVWTWQKSGPAAMGNDRVQPQPEPPGPQTIWFNSPPPSNGVLCVFVQGNWPANAVISIVARAHDSTTDTGGYDLDGPTVILTGNGGTTADCVARIVDVIRCAFLQQAGVVVEVDFEEVPPGSGVFKITVKIPGGFIDRGILSICVSAPARPVIDEVTPNTGREGDMVTIRGRGFGNNPDNICLVVMEGGGLALGAPEGAAAVRRFVPLQPLMVSPMEIIARLGPVPPDAQPGPIMVGLGRGQRGRFRPAFFDVFVADDVWTWSRTDPAAADAGGQFQPQPTQPGPNQRWFFSGPPTNGMLCVFLEGNWPSNAVVTVIARAHDNLTGAGGHDLAAPNVRLLGAGTTLECAQKIADILRCAFIQQAGVMVEVTVELLPDGRVKITVKIPDGYIDRGMLTICVGAPSGTPQ